MDKVCITETSTDKVPNASPTAASAVSDLYGMSVLNACKKLMERLKPYLANNTTFCEAVTNDYFDRINLSAQGLGVAGGTG